MEYLTFRSLCHTYGTWSNGTKAGDVNNKQLRVGRGEQRVDLSNRFCTSILYIHLPSCNLFTCICTFAYTAKNQKVETENQSRKLRYFIFSLPIGKKRDREREMGLLFTIREMVFNVAFLYLKSTGKIRSTVLRIIHSSCIRAWEMITC